jgi:hypothetical protein
MDQFLVRPVFATHRWEGITAKDAHAYDPLCNASSEDVSRGAHPINCVD